MEPPAAEPGGGTMRRGLSTLAAVMACASLTGCAARDADAEVRALVAAAERAAEARDTGFFRDVVAESYADTRGNGRDEIIDLVRGFFFLNTSLEVINRIDEIVLAGDEAATVTLQTAVLGRSAGRGVLGVDADLYAIELELVRQGSAWRIIGADASPVLR